MKRFAMNEKTVGPEKPIPLFSNLKYNQYGGIN